MFKQLMRRKDTRLEVIGVAVVFLLIMALAFSGRKAQVAAMNAPAALLPAGTASAGGWKFDFLALEECSARKIVVAVVRVQGRALADNGSPVSDVTAPGLEFDGGAWTPFAQAPIVVSYGGACGAPEQCRLRPGEGLLILRLRGKPASNSSPFHFKFSGIPVQFDMGILSRVNNSPDGLVGTIFGR